MKARGIVWAFALIVLIPLVFSAQSTSIALQGKLTNTTTGVTIYTASLRINISDQSGITVWNQSYPNAVTSGFFDLLLGNEATNPLNLTYNENYNISVYVGSSSTPIGGTYKFRSSVGDVSLSNLSAGNLSAAGNVSIGSLFIDKTNGFIGIGTTSPQIALHVLKSGTVGTPAINTETAGVFQNSGISTTDSRISIISGTLGTSNIYFGDTTTDQAGKIVYSNSEDSFTISTNLSRGIMKMLSMGNFGINTSVPSQTLTVQGTLNITPAGQGGLPSLFINSLGNVGMGTAAPLSTLHVNGSGANGGFLVTNESGMNVFFANSTAGTISIGTSNPSNFSKLQVIGTINGRQPNILLGQGAYVQGHQSGSGAWLTKAVLQDSGGNWYYSDGGAAGGALGFSSAGSIYFQTTPSGSSGSSATLTTRMLIDNTGAIDIGTASLGANLDIGGDLAILFDGTSGENGILIKDSTDGSGAYFIDMQGTGGRVGAITRVGTTLAVNYGEASDRRLKENIKPTSTGLSTLLNISVREFNYIPDPNKTRIQGFIAQELYPLYPQAVIVGGANASEQPWQVDYGKLTPLLIQSVQELNAKVEHQEKQITLLTQKLCNENPDEQWCH